MAVLKRTYIAKKPRVKVTLTNFANGLENRMLEWFADRFLWYVRREMTSGIFENPTGTSLRAWRYKIEANVVRFFNRDYIFYLNRGRRSQVMKWLEGKVIPIRVGNQIIFRTAKNVGRPNPKSKHGRLFYMKQPDKGKPYLGFIDRAIEKANTALRRKIKRGGFA